MFSRSLCRFTLIAFAGCAGLLAAEADTEFRAARQDFLVRIKRLLPADRLAAVERLGEFPRAESAELLIKRGLHDSDMDVRRATRKALRNLVEDDAVRQYVFQETRKAFRKAVVPDDAGELLRLMSANADPRQQDELIKALDVYLGSAKGNLELPIRLIDEFAEERNADALRAIKFFARAKAFESVFGYRRCIIQGMIQIPETEAVTWLIQKLPQTQGLIEHDIVQYLTKLTGQKFADNEKEWRAWWSENAESFEFPAEPLPREDVEINHKGPRYYGIPVCAKRVVFVLDTSGSMRGEPLVAVKDALLKVVDQLPPEVHFDVVLFDRMPTVWQPRLVKATPQSKMDIAQIVRARGTGRGTASFKALEAAFNLEPEAIFFLSDGRPTDSQPDQLLETYSVLNRTRRVSLHTIGVLTDRDNSAELILFMKPLAGRNFGFYRLVE